MACFIALPLFTPACPSGSPPRGGAVLFVSRASFVTLLLNCLIEAPLFGRSCGAAEIVRIGLDRKRII